ncbi:MAG: low molecular weight phosphotyrosine protein phosphatase [Micavibrio aeruginosavorus]|uniref:Low molecular weight phosphotyrosine protein phosphatase n=1 Tax=Micavibrio aeruginosavorus TaxID=349221 RepID=A0A7T5R086_9BACT|nr:MAG: low molecular weight phosphotyrosine protein phosphatase [Micavibrio aeruginosavorus]
MSQKKPLSVLFVCTGNICRSPTAEGIFRALVRKTGVEERFLIDSAGTGGWHHGEAPDPRSIKTATKRGVDISSLRARALRNEDYNCFNYLIAMDRTHLAHMQRNRPPSASGHVSLLLSYAGAEGHQDVPDPYYGSSEDFERVYDLIEAGACGLLDFIMIEQGERE